MCIIGAAIIFAGYLFNPFSWNDATERTVVTQMDGSQFVQFQSGIYYSGFFAKEVKWPNQISISHTKKEFDGDIYLDDNTCEIGIIKDVRFNDATTASVSGITQYILPNDEKAMLEIHNAHKTPEAFVQRRLAPYTVECLKSSAQLMSSEAHYSGGRAQMTQDYMDQLKNGSYLLRVREDNTYDTLEKTNKKLYIVEIQKSKNGTSLRKFSSIKEYHVVVGDAQITDVDYEPKVDEMLAKKIQAATDASVSKQKLMTAEQQKLTARAEGERKLTEIEYEQKQEQTKQIVAAETKVELAKQDKLQQQIAYEGSILEAKKIKELADAEAYAKAKVMQADGALDKKLDAYKEVQGYWAEAFGAYKGNIVPLYQTGGSAGQNGMGTMMDVITAKALRDLNLDMDNK